jgi:hypothetical protein
MAKTHSRRPIDEFTSVDTTPWSFSIFLIFRAAFMDPVGYLIRHLGDRDELNAHPLT